MSAISFPPLVGPRWGLMALMLACVLAPLVMGGYALTRQVHLTEEMRGCDLYGYKRPARLFREEGFWRGVVPSYEGEVPAKLLGPVPAEWRHAAVPLCHTYQPGTDMIVGNYPPLTSFALSFFDEAHSVKSLAAWMTVFTSLAFAAAVGFVRPAHQLGIAALGVFCLYLFALGPVSYNYVLISWSHYLSVPLMLGSGALLALSLQSQRWARPAAFSAGAIISVALMARADIAIVGLSTAVGLGSLILIRPERWHWFTLSFMFGAGLLVGFTPEAIVNWLNTGNPLLFTYNLPDQRLFGLDVVRDIMTNLRLYTMGPFVLPFWIMTALIVVSAVRWRHQAHQVALVVLILNLAYYVVKQINQPGYLVNATVFGASLVLAAAIFSHDRPRRYVLLVPATATALMIGFAAVPTVARVLPWGAGAVSDQRSYPPIIMPDFRLADHAVVYSYTTGGLFDRYARRMPTQMWSLNNWSYVEAARRSGLTQYFVDDHEWLRRWISEHKLERVGSAFGHQVYVLRP